MAGPAAVVWALDQARPSRGTKIARVATLVAAAGEIIGDKLTRTPSRLSPAPLTARILAGAGSAASLTVASKRPPAIVLSALIGAAGGYLGSRLGAAFRGMATKQFGKDLPGALVEDAATYTAAFALTRHSFRRTLRSVLHSR